MDIIAKISKGSKMDQIYLPKNRSGLATGQYVMITPLENKLPRKEFKPCFYNLVNLEPIKLELIKEIFNIVQEINPENIIITGSFLEKGFKFNDIDILIINEEKIDANKLKNRLENSIGIKTHIIHLSYKNIVLGLSSDPLYSMMLSRCVSKNKLIFKLKKDIDYKLLDFQLLKSKSLIENFDILNGTEKYYLTLNMVSILLFIQNSKLSKEAVDSTIEKEFNININEIRENTLEKVRFIKRYNRMYNKTFNLIMENIK
jgi:hypothetical protein